jgi:hypothetical protein
MKMINSINIKKSLVDKAILETLGRQALKERGRVDYIKGKAYEIIRNHQGTDDELMKIMEKECDCICDKVVYCDTYPRFKDVNEEQLNEYAAHNLVIDYLQSES